MRRILWPTATIAKRNTTVLAIAVLAVECSTNTGAEKVSSVAVLWAAKNGLEQAYGKLPSACLGPCKLTT